MSSATQKPDNAHFLSRSRAAKVESRMGPDLRTAIEYHPGLAGIALWVSFADNSEQNSIAMTDGKTVFAGPRYSAYPDRERLFILLHELLHVALAHPIRMQLLAKRHHDFDPLAYNIACDAIINTALAGSIKLTPPPDAIMLEPLLGELGLWRNGDNIDTVVKSWSSEALYYAIIKRKPKLQCKIFAHDLIAGGGGKKQDESKNDGKERAYAEAEIRKWARQLQLARGVIPGTFLRLSGDLPKVKTPWERLLRDQLYRHLGKKPVPDFMRPSRRWLALEHYLYQTEGVLLPFEPARRPGKAGRIAVALDTSGSIDEEMLSRFVGEIAAIMERTSSELYLIVCDADVHQTFELKGYEGQNYLRKLKYKGGGGTDFEPAIKKALAWRPDVMVYLTDLYGPAGDEPKDFPLFWAVPPGLPEVKSPWGHLIELD